MASKHQQAALDPIAQKEEPTRQTDNSIHPIPVTAVREMETTRVARAKETEKARETKESLSKELRKESEGIPLRPHPQQGIKRTLQLQPMKPPRRTGMNGTKTSTMPIKGGAMSYMKHNRIHAQHVPHAERHGKRKKEEQEDQKAEAQFRTRGRIPCRTVTRVTIP